MKKKKLEIINGQIYPLTIIVDRYNGSYSGGSYVAMQIDSYDVPREIDGDDITCMDFWEKVNKEGELLYGVGSTAQEAEMNLLNKYKHYKIN